MQRSAVQRVNGNYAGPSGASTRICMSFAYTGSAEFRIRSAGAHIPLHHGVPEFEEDLRAIRENREK